MLELIGRGGMGAVYKVRQRELDRLVALKILPPEVGHDPAFAQRFAREARALAKLNHPHIVAVFDSGKLGEFFYLMMEFVDGVNLRQMLRAGELSPAQALAIVPQVCDALQYAHDEGIVHRDIKPENILIDKRGRVKIADFGLAKLLANEGHDSAAASLLTATAQVMGTLRYMAPEQMESAAHVDHRADIYSLGVVFYELLTGEVPMGRFQPPSQKVEVDVRLDDIVLRTLAREPARRYQHASEVKTDVQSIASSPQAKLPPRTSQSILLEVDLEEARQEVRIPGMALVCLGVLCFVMSFLVVCVMPTFWWLLPIGRSGPMKSGAPEYYNVAPHGEDHTTLPAETSMRQIASPLVLCGVQTVVASAWALEVPCGPLLSVAIFAQQPAMRETPTWVGVLFAIVVGAGMMFQLPLSLLMILGGWRMQRLESHGLAVLASLVALLPCQPLFPLAVVIGIWSLNVLNRPHVKAAFQRALEPSQSTRVRGSQRVHFTDESPRHPKETSYRHNDGRPSARNDHKAPSLRLIIFGVLALIAHSSLFLLGFFNDPAPLDRPFVMALVGVPFALLAIVGGVCMHRRASRALAILGSCAAMVPVGPLVLLGFPLGLWALLILRRPDVRHSFNDEDKKSFENGIAIGGSRRWVLAFIVALLAIGLAVGAVLFMRWVRSSASQELAIVATFGDLDRMRTLLMRGADPNARDAYGTPAIVAAATGGHDKAIELLCLHGCDVNARDAQGQTALMKAALGGHLQAIITLKNRGAEAQSIDNERRPALYWALVGGSDACVEQILRFGGDNGAHRKDPLGRSMLAVAAAHCPASVTRLITQTATEVDERDNAHMTPLMHAAAAGHTQAMRVLIVNFADVNARDTNGLAAIDWAVYHDQESAVNLLVEKGVEKTAITHFWEGYREALSARFAEAIPPIETALKVLPYNTRQSFQVGRQLFVAEHPRLFALAALAECELRSGNTDAARKHYEELAEKVRGNPMLIYTRMELSPQRLATRVADPDNYVQYDFTLTFDAMQTALGDPLRTPAFTVREEAVTTMGDARSGTRTLNTGSGTAQGLFAK